MSQTALADPLLERFTLELFKGKSVSKIAAKLGIPERSAYNYAKREDVQARLSILQSRAASKAVIDKSFVMEGLARAVRIGFGDETIKLKKTAFGMTIETEQTTLELPASIRALELLGKELGMFKDKSEVEINVIHLIADKPMTADGWEKAFAHARLTATDAEQD
jgi:hypothetical protein